MSLLFFLSSIKSVYVLTYNYHDVIVVVFFLVVLFHIIPSCNCKPRLDCNENQIIVFGIKPG